MTVEQLKAAWALLDELEAVLSRVGGTDEEWNTFSKIQSEVNETKQNVSDQLDALKAWRDATT